MMRMTILGLALSLALSAAASGSGGSTPDLVAVLPPPPAAGSLAAQHELQTVLGVQASRTPADEAAARADNEHSVFRFADVFGSSFEAAKLPHTAALFARLVIYDKAAVKPAKIYWHHPRPPIVSAQVQPLAQEKADDWSYPSGHATLGYSEAVLLANMVPEKRAAIFARADLYAQHRVVMGVHFPSDIEAGRLAGTVIGADLLHDPDWQADYEAARLELRAALKLPTTPPKDGPG
ncbi:phosphatase PAP2 family protein [Dyella halodurans]|uniref:Acid phosphatase n=1 Tax=Dyella halodurans TaxID=1920171 RepID=A0ABV9C1N2_9GAMM|nr:phosphatase PAP2 family protein [Dyella halodurans]